MSYPHKWPASWVFSLLILPLGMVIGFNFTALPYLLARAGVPVDQIADINSLSNLPGILGIVLAPVVDIKLRRRTWLAIGAFGTALGACLYFPLIGASHVILLTAIVFAAGMVSFLVVAACGGMMVKLLPEADQSVAAGGRPRRRSSPRLARAADNALYCRDLLCDFCRIAWADSAHDS